MYVHGQPRDIGLQRKVRTRRDLVIIEVESIRGLRVTEIIKEKSRERETVEGENAAE